MADNRVSEKMEEQIMDMNISNISCSSEVISPQTTINDDSNNGDIKNSTCSKSVAVETKIICSDNQDKWISVILSCSGAEKILQFLTGNKDPI